MGNLTIPHHSRTISQIDALVNNKTQSILIEGSTIDEVGEIATYISMSALNLDDKSLAKSAKYFKLGLGDKQSEISISSVREVIKNNRLKSAQSLADFSSVIYIENAQTLSIEAQTALLKSIEEPNSGTLFILGTTNSRSLLPTILSRVQSLLISPIALNRAQSHYANEFSSEEIKKAWIIGKSNPGLIDKLLRSGNDNDSYSDLVLAKDYLKSKDIDRLLILSKFSTKESINLFISALGSVLKAVSDQSVNNSNTKMLTRLTRSRRVLIEHQKALEANCSVKLVSMSLILNLHV
jgi:hypothetical protein